MIIQTLVYIYGFILLLSAVFTFFLFLAYKEHLLKLLLYFWLSGLVSFVAQGALNSADAFGFLAFATHALSIFFLLKIYYVLSGLKLPVQKYGLILMLGLVSSLIGFSLGVDFVFSSSFLCLSIVYIFVESIIKITKKNSDPLVRGLSLLLLLNALHFADYPFIRPNPDMAIFGFSIALGFYFIYSIYIPLFIIKKTSDNYSTALEQQVSARTYELNNANEMLSLTNNELVSSNKSLELVTKENQMLLNILVHDISNPIQIIIAFVDKTATTEMNSLSKNLGVKAKSALATILETLTTVKNYHVARVGKIAPQLAKFDIVETVKAVVEQFEDKLIGKNIKLEIDDSAANKKIINSDHAWIKNQICPNIISNAIKFSYVGGAIKIQVTSTEYGIVIKFRDFGSGIPEDAKAKLFSSATTTSTFGTLGEKGTGLGMPIVKEYVSRLRGTVEISKLPPAELGTCIEVFFPYDLDNLEDKAAS